MPPRKAALLLLAAAWLVPSGDSKGPRVGEGGPRVDVAAQSVDDMYRGCEHLMKQRLPELLAQEQASSPILGRAWTKAKSEWMRKKKVHVFPPSMKAFCSVAVVAYSLEEPPLYKQFNNATRLGWANGRSSYARYPFKALHFLLTQAPQAVWNTRPSCTTVYRGTTLDFAVSRLFRFGQFSSTSRSATAAAKFGRRTFFELLTCTGYRLRDLSHFPGEQEVLVPPYELFQVQEIKHNAAGKTVRARSAALCSNHNCALTGQGDPNVRKCPAHRVLYL